MKISSNYKRLLILNVIALIIFVYINIFVNLYIWDLNKSITDMALFNCILYIGCTLSYVAGAKMLKGKNVQFIMRLFAISSLITFSFVSYVSFQPKVLWIITLGILVGFITGFFWIANNYAINSLGKDREIMDFLTKQTIASSLIAIFVPVLSAIVIKYFGYIGSFFLMLVFSMLMFFTVNLIPKIKLISTPEEDKVEILKKPKTKWLLLSAFIGGAFGQFQFLFVLFFTFSITNNKMIIALCSVAYTIITGLTLFAYKKIKHLDEYQWLFVGMILMAIGFVIALQGGIVCLILSNVLTTIGIFFVNTIYMAQEFKVFENEPPAVKVKNLVGIEISLNIGRSLMLFLILFVRKAHGPYFIFLMILSIILSLLLPFVQKKMLQ